MPSPADLSCTELLDAYRARTLSPVEAVASCLERIEAVDSQLMAVMTLCADQAMAQAKASAQRWVSGTSLAMDGVPFGLKDLIYTRGIRTTGGSLVYEHLVPDINATVADRLTAAGGLLVAKVQTWEFAADGVPFGFTRNPWNLGHMSGGSSSGSAAALSARELPFAVGTNTGGSIRVPASFCGITAMKPTSGRVSRFGVMPLSWTLDHVGPMARSVADIALSLEVIAGHDPRDPSSSTAPVDAYRDALQHGLAGVRIGVPDNWFFDICDPQVAAATHEAIRTLESAGATIVHVRFPILDEFNVVSLLWLITNSECASLHEINSDVLHIYNPDNAGHVVHGRSILAIDYMRALRERNLIQRDFERAFEDIDVLITPGTPSVAPRVEREDSIVDAWALIGEERYPWLEVDGRTTCVFNLTGMPALTLPSGINDAGLPMSMQIVARPFAESACLRVGHAYQSLTSHHLSVPPLVQSLATATRDVRS